MKAGKKGALFSCLLHALFGIIYAVYFWTRAGGRRLLSKIDPTVKRMTCYIAACVLVLSLLMEAVYLILGAWEMPVLWGNLLGAFAAVLNFFLMGLTIQRSLRFSEEDAIWYDFQRVDLNTVLRSR